MAAFRAEALEQHMERQKMLIPQFAVADFVRDALPQKCRMAFESVRDPNASRFGS